VGVRLIRALQLLVLRARDIALSNQIDNGEALKRHHRAELIAAYRARRQVRNQLVMLESPRALIAESMRGQAAR